MDILQKLVDLGAPVMMPIIFSIFAICLGVKFGKAIKSGLLVGIGFIGLNTVITLLTQNLGPVAEAMVEPDLKSKELQEHFSCSTSKDLAIKLFGNELTMLSDEVAKLSGMEESVEEIDDEVKN